MKHYLNTPDLRNKVNKFCDELFHDRTFTKPKEQLAALCSQDLARTYFAGTDITHQQALLYICTIIHHYDAIIRADNAAMKDWIIVFGDIIESNQLTKGFYDAIVKAMRYDDLREKEYLRFLKEMKINTCVYCHAQLIVTIDISFYERQEGNNNIGDVKDMKGILEADHRYPQSGYPFLCTTLYNLYPVCAYCNKTKSTNSAGFEFYKDSPSPDIFRFTLKDHDIIKMQLGDISVDDIAIDIEIDDKTCDRKVMEGFLQLFKIRQLYNTQKDIVQELLAKKEIYTPTYIASLKDDFKDLFKDPDIISRMILGNYHKPEDVWKRPMAKFMQDIARDINLLD